MECRTCTHSVITQIAECTLKDDYGKYVHPDGLCPEELTCAHWQQGDEHDVRANGIDWSSAIEIEIE